jgi:hypothetical protein
MQHLPSQPLIPVQAVTLVMALDIDLDAPPVDIELGTDAPMAAGADARLFGTGTLAGRASTVPGWRTQPAVHYRGG